MKKIIVRFLALGLILSLSSCGSHPPQVSNASDIEKLDPQTTGSIVGRGLSESDIPSLAKLDGLQQLFLNHGDAAGGLKMTDSGLKALSETKLPSLRYIGISYSRNITDNGIEAISKISTLKQIIINGLPEITDKSLEYLAKMPHLEQLFISGCPGITDEGIQLLRTYPSLNWVMLGGMDFGSSLEMKKVLEQINNIDMNLETQITVEGVVNAFKGSKIERIEIDTLNPEFFTEQSKSLFCKELSGYTLIVRTLVGPKLEKIKAWRVSECVKTQ